MHIRLTQHPRFAHISLRIRVQRIQPPADLESRIAARITQARALRARREAVFHGGLGLAALIALIPALQHALTSATESGVYDYISLVATDSSYVLDNWRSTAFSIVESVPVMGIALATGALVVCVYSLRKSATAVRRSHLVRTIPTSILAKV